MEAAWGGQSEGGGSTVVGLVCGVTLKEEVVTRVADSHRLGGRRQRHLGVGTLVAEDSATVTTMVLWSGIQYNVV